MGKMGYYAKCRFCPAVFHSKTRSGLGQYTKPHAMKEHPMQVGMAKMAAGGGSTLNEGSPWQLFDFYP